MTLKIVNGWVDEAIEIDYPQKSMSRSGYTPKYIILHGTAGGSSAEAIANYFATSSEDASSHFIIGQDGHVVQGISMNDAAWANGPIDGTPADNLGFRTESDGIHRDSWWNPNLNPNYITISIEHCKAHDDNSDQLTPAQQNASFQLVQCICDTYNIPKRFADANGGIAGHFSMSAENRQRCPGIYPWQELFDYLNSGNEEETMVIDLATPRVSDYFQATGDPAVWKCIKTGFLVGHGILGFYQKFGGDALCGLTYLGLALSNEIAITGHPGSVYQKFERGTVVWNPDHTFDSPPNSGPVYMAHTDAKF